jgi:hypothetical protein
MKNASFHFRYSWASMLATGLFLASCQATTAPVPDVTVVVDSASYHLRPTVGPSYEIVLTATISNQGPGAIYIGQDCPVYSMSRPKTDSRRLWFGQVACSVAGGIGPTTITLAPGESHTQTFKLNGSVQTQSNPPITMDDLVGPAVFGFEVSTNLRTFAPRYSAPFVLQPPT